MNNSIIIVAGGKGVRMGSDIPKQFLEIQGLPIIMHTINLFNNFDSSMEIVVVLPSESIEYWKKLIKKYSFSVKHKVAEGGHERFYSVKNGLKSAVNENGIIGVHDAVRPLVSKEVISRVYNEAGMYGNSVPVIPVNESLRESSGSVCRPVVRSRYVIVQTPQCFRASILRSAYLQSFREEFTDDATVVESDGQHIRTTEGNNENIKITTRQDLLTATALFSENQH